MPVRPCRVCRTKLGKDGFVKRSRQHPVPAAGQDGSASELNLFIFLFHLRQLAAAALAIPAAVRREHLHVSC